MVTVPRVDVLMSAFGRRLRAARTTAGFDSAEKFAEMLRLHAHRYRKYERGEAFPPLDILEQVVLATRVDLHWLILGSKIGRRDATNGDGPQGASSTD